LAFVEGLAGSSSVGGKTANDVGTLALSEEPGGKKDR
jgi:hypothetical protein